MLISDVVKNNLCIGCGVCNSHNQNKEKFYEMKFNEDGFLTPQIIEADLSEPPEAIEVCPFGNSINNNEDYLSEQFFEKGFKDNRIGKYIDTYVGHSIEYRKKSSSGGIATYVFGQLLKRNIVDIIYVVKENDKGGYSYNFFDNVEEIEKISKTRYIPVTLEKLFDEIEKIDKRIAISGVACFVKAIRLKQVLDAKLKMKIPFLVGIICGGLKSRHYTDFLSFNAGIEDRYSKQDYRIKDNNASASAYSFGAFDESEKVFKTMKMKKVGDMWGSGLFKSSACDYCSDVTTELADISLGDAWINPYVKDGKGTSVIITRNKIADLIINEGIINGELLVESINKSEIIESQKSSFIHRQIGLKYRLKQKEKLTKFKIPARKRLLRNIPYEYKRVLNYRSYIRQYSLEYWNNKESRLKYSFTIAGKQKKLKKITVFYHRIQKLKSIINLKNLKSDV